MNSDKNPDLTAPFAPAYCELFDNIRPSEQLLAATRSLYTLQTSRTPAFPRRVWPAAAAATLCAACLLLTIGLQLWPQPKEIMPPGSMLRTASQAPDQSAALSSQPDEKAAGRIAPAMLAENTEQNPAIAPQADANPIESLPEICSYPLAKQSDQAGKPFIKPAEFIHLKEMANIWQLMPQWAARALSWLTLW